MHIGRITEKVVAAKKRFRGKVGSFPHWKHTSSECSTSKAQNLWKREEKRAPQIEKM